MRPIDVEAFLKTMDNKNLSHEERTNAIDSAGQLGLNSRISPEIINKVQEFGSGYLNYLTSEETEEVSKSYIKRTYLDLLAGQVNGGKYKNAR